MDTESADYKHLYNKKDPSSYANPTEAISTNINLVWDIDFEQQTITGSVEHTIRVVADGASHVDFDSSKINIVGDVLVNGEVGKFVAEPVHKVLGTKLVVTIPQDLRKEGTTFSVMFKYYITTEASATQWLPASATKGQKHPYLFTQCQAIHARSLMPCQDSPGIKTQYTARVTAPKWCTVLMSALADGTSEDASGKNVFVWKQPNPTPAYLVALAAGRMESREISDRVRVWAEPEVVEAALFEFSETEEFVKAAEELTGCPYQWGRYDILCLPPSFPYGGMENPCLTFATPTLLAGDKSLADVIAHEIAHSWTGNLVTNHNWDHFWLNEGWTVWLERKIVSKVRNNDEYGRLSGQIGWKHLLDDIKLHGEENPVTALVWRLADGEDPDDSYSSVPYEKGCNLLSYLEEVVGAELFAEFAASYIDTFKFSTVTTGEFRDHFMGFIEERAAADAATAADSTSSSTPSKGKSKNAKKKAAAKAKAETSSPQATKSTAAMLAAQAVQGLDWNSLFYTPGVPTDVTSFSNSLSKAAEELARKWIAHAATYKTDAPPAGTSADDIKGWSTQQKNVFLETMQNFSKKSLSHASEVFPVPFLELMDRTYAFSESKNAEIMLRWHTLCLESEAAWVLPAVVEFITSQGRMKFARPLYRLLRDTSIGKQLAIDTFEANKDIYHPIARKMIATDLKRKAEAEEEAIEEQLQAEHELLAAAVGVPAVEEVSMPSPEHAVNMDPLEAEDVSDEEESAAPVMQSTPEVTPSKQNGVQDYTPAPISTPHHSYITPETPCSPEPVTAPVASPAAVAATPEATPKKATPAATPEATPKKATPAATPVSTPAAPAPTPAATPAPVAVTPAVATPEASSTQVTPAKTPMAATPTVQSPAATPAAAAVSEPEVVATKTSTTTTAASTAAVTPTAAPVAKKAATPTATSTDLSLNSQWSFLPYLLSAGVVLGFGFLTYRWRLKK